MKYGLGLFKSIYDRRDYLVRSFFKAEKLPLKFSLRDKIPPVRNQGNEGSCAGHAGAYAKEYQELMDVQKELRLSPRYIYEEAKLISGHSAGTTLRAICEVLIKKGICEEKLYPYIPNEPNERSPLADKNAEKYKIRAYARVTNIDELKQIIYLSRLPSETGIRTCFSGITLYKGATGKQAKTTGFTPNPTCWDTINGAIGGHALWPIEWDDESKGYENDGHIAFEGSWGKDFGDKGIHYFSYKNLKANMIDCMAIVDKPGSGLPLTIADLPKTGKKVWV